jgi:hypothetical protein
MDLLIYLLTYLLTYLLSSTRKGYKTWNVICGDDYERRISCDEPAVTWFFLIVSQMA